MGSGDVIGLDVEGLDAAGSRISGRGAHGGSTARRLHHGLASAHAHVGHPEVASAMAAFVRDSIEADAHQLGPNVVAGGHGVSRVATTARDSDNDGARDLHTYVSGTETGSTSLLRDIELPE